MDDSLRDLDFYMFRLQKELAGLTEKLHRLNEGITEKTRVREREEKIKSSSPVHGMASVVFKRQRFLTTKIVTPVLCHCVSRPAVLKHGPTKLFFFVSRLVFFSNLCVFGSG